MTSQPATIRVYIPLTLKKRNGRPKILPPDNAARLAGRRQDLHVSSAICRAWGGDGKWKAARSRRRRTSPRGQNPALFFVNRFNRQVYSLLDVSPTLVNAQQPCPVTIEALADKVILLWVDQKKSVS